MATFTGTSADEIIDPYEVSDTVTTNGGAFPGAGEDLIEAKGGKDTVGSGNGDDDVFLGGGDDQYFWGGIYGDGSDLVRGGSGYDTASFKGFGASTDIAAENGKALYGNDGFTVNLDGVERINVQALDGADNIEIDDLTGTDVALLAIDLDDPDNPGGPDGSSDHVEVNATETGDDVVVREVNGAVRIEGLHAEIRIRSADSGDNDTLTLKGGGGADHLDASALPASHFRITIDGGNGADLIEGSKGADTIFGGKGLDTLMGGKGADYFFGGDAVGVDNARDVFTGGGGADSFVLSLPTSSEKADLITDMKPGVDMLIFGFPEIGDALDDIASDWGADHFRLGRNAADEDDFVLYRKSTGGLFFDADGDGDGAKMKIATLSKDLDLTWQDFGFLS